MTDTTTLADQIRAALDAEEAIARAADGPEWGVGHLDTLDWGPAGEHEFGTTVFMNGETWPKPVRVDGSHIYSKKSGERPPRVIADMNDGYGTSRHLANATHAVRQDPAATLRRLAGHRKILDECAALAGQCQGEPGDTEILWWIDNTLLPAMAEAYGIEPTIEHG